MLFMAYGLLLSVCKQSVRLTLGVTLILTQHVKITPHLLSFDLLFHPGNGGKISAPKLLLAAVFWHQAETQLAQTLVSLSLQGKKFM